MTRVVRPSLAKIQSKLPSVGGNPIERKSNLIKWEVVWSTKRKGKVRS